VVAAGAGAAFAGNVGAEPPYKFIHFIFHMSASLIDGTAIAAAVRGEVKEAVEAWVAQGGRRPGLATVLVGDDPASAVYVSNKQRSSAEVGIEGFSHQLPADSTQAEVEALLQELNADERVSGILLQLPTPSHINGSHLTTLIDPAKDVDGLTPISAGLLAKGLPGLRPCTPAGCMELLRRYDVTLKGAEAVVIGRSDLVGKPVAALLLAEHATVTICHSRTRDLGEVCRRADVLVAAVGRPKMVTADWIKPGATVIDVGINRTQDGLVGDVDFDSAVQVAGLITPVPRGVGPMTIAMLLRNTLEAAQARQAAREGSPA
jgi:methylenetetrahydrofolate dehydrogenase (NADP+) / methenyltetrahydrofolate cyclohydrolase